MNGDSAVLYKIDKAVNSDSVYDNAFIRLGFVGIYWRRILDWNIDILFRRRIKYVGACKM